MSSSTDSLRRAQVLRDIAITPGPALTDLSCLAGAARRAVDPAIVEEAQAAGHAAGYEVGRADGYDAGRQEALAEATLARTAYAEAATAALAALSQATTELTEREARSLADIESVIITAAFELATALVGRELELTVAPGRDALRRALRLAAAGEPAIARLHPDDVATLGDHADLTLGRAVTIVADPSVERGGSVLDVGPGRIDAQIGPALDRVKEALTS